MKALVITALIALAGTSGGALHIAATPCPTEDSNLCYWDGTARGNKTGESFIALSDGLSIVWDTNETEED